VKQPRVTTEIGWIIDRWTDAPEVSAGERRGKEFMWPKLIAQLFELLPHVARLVPMADKYFSSRTSSEVAMVAMAEGVRGDMDQVTKAHTSLYRQLQDQSAQIAEVSEEVKRARVLIEQHEQRMLAVEANVASLGWWVKGGVSLLAVLLIVVIVMLMRGR
jgi:hypothetical protein